jgi:AcrR family transcriptional regulator
VRGGSAETVRREEPVLPARKRTPSRAPTSPAANGRRTRANARTPILEAAATLVATAGVDALTFDGLAEATGISKGGILYHFPSKHDLLHSLVAESVTRFEELWDAFAQRDDVVPGRQARAFLDSYVAVSRTERVANLNFALLAAAAADPTVMKPYAEAYERWQERLADDGIDEATATILRLVADGLWAGDLFRLPRLDDRLVTAIVERLRAMTTE